MGTAILHIMTGCDPKAEDDFNGWYNEEHLPRLAEVDGVFHARRFIEAHGQPTEGDRLPLRYQAIYELADPAVATDPSFTHAGRPTPWRDRDRSAHGAARPAVPPDGRRTRLGERPVTEPTGQ